MLDERGGDSSQGFWVSETIVPEESCDHKLLSATTRGLEALVGPTRDGRIKAVVEPVG